MNEEEKDNVIINYATSTSGNSSIQFNFNQLLVEIWNRNMDFLHYYKLISFKL